MYIFAGCIFLNISLLFHNYFNGIFQISRTEQIVTTNASNMRHFALADFNIFPYLFQRQQLFIFYLNSRYFGWGPLFVYLYFYSYLESIYLHGCVGVLLDVVRNSNVTLFFSPVWVSFKFFSSLTHVYGSMYIYICVLWM